jgi:hypothetical protein
MPAIMMDKRHQLNLAGETMREIGILQAVFGFMDYMIRDNPVIRIADPAAIQQTAHMRWTVFGFTTMGVGFIILGLYAQFKADVH